MSTVRGPKAPSRQHKSLRGEPSLSSKLLKSLKLGLFFSVLSVVLWQWGPITDTVDNFIDTVAHQGGVQLADVAVEGRAQVDSKDVLKCVGLDRGETLTQLNPQEVKACLEKNPWVRSATVIRNFPHQVLIQLVERDPVAIWQHKSKHKLLDREGAVIEVSDVSQYSHLLLVAGDQAPQHLNALTKVLAEYPDIKEHVTAATHIRGSRWDFKMNSGMIVKLPDENIDKALKQLRKLAAQYHLWERGYSVLDMRLEGQLILKPIKAEKSDKPSQKDV